MENSALFLGIFFIVAAAQGLFFSLVQLSSAKSLNASKILLSLIILGFSLSLIESGLWITEKIDHFVNFVCVSQPLPVLFGPLVYLYFKTSFFRHSLHKKDALHFIPFILCFLYCSQFYFSSTEAKMAMMRDEISFRDFFAVRIGSLYQFLLAMISLLFYSFMTWREFYARSATLTGVRKWFIFIYGVFAVYVLNFLLFNVLTRMGWIGGCSDYGIATTMGVFVYLFAWLGFVSPKIFEGYSLSKAVLHKRGIIKNISATDPELATLEKNLRVLMETEKLYKEEDINLESLAKKVGVSRHLLSGAINSTGMNFFEYVNYWRIEEAKKLLSGTSKKELNVIEVAYEVGFNNKVSFNKFFKKSTGLTPTEFRKFISGGGERSLSA